MSTTDFVPTTMKSLTDLVLNATTVAPNVTTSGPLYPIDPPLDKCNYFVNQNKTIVFHFSNQVHKIQTFIGCTVMRERNGQLDFKLFTGTGSVE